MPDETTPNGEKQDEEPNSIESIFSEDGEVKKQYPTDSGKPLYQYASGADVDSSIFSGAGVPKEEVRVRVHKSHIGRLADHSLRGDDKGKMDEMLKGVGIDNYKENFEKLKERMGRAYERVLNKETTVASLPHFRDEIIYLESKIDEACSQIIVKGKSVDFDWVGLQTSVKHLEYTLNIYEVLGRHGNNIIGVDGFEGLQKMLLDTSEASAEMREKIMTAMEEGPAEARDKIWEFARKAGYGVDHGDMKKNVEALSERVEEIAIRSEGIQDGTKSTKIDISKIARNNSEGFGRIEGKLGNVVREIRAQNDVGRYVLIGSLIVATAVAAIGLTYGILKGREVNELEKAAVEKESEHEIEAIHFELDKNDLNQEKNDLNKKFEEANSDKADLYDIIFEGHKKEMTQAERIKILEAGSTSKPIDTEEGPGITEIITPVVPEPVVPETTEVTKPVVPETEEIDIPQTGMDDSARELIEEFQPTIEEPKQSKPEEIKPKEEGMDESARELILENSQSIKRGSKFDNGVKELITE